MRMGLFSGAHLPISELNTFLLLLFSDDAAETKLVILVFLSSHCVSFQVD